MSITLRKRLPHCDTLLRTYLSPWYDVEDRPTITRPDAYVITGFDGSPLDLDALQYLPKSILKRNKKQLQLMIDAATKEYLQMAEADKLDLAVLNAVDKHFNRKVILELINRSDPADFTNAYVAEVCKFGAILGHLFSQTEDCGWLYSQPVFDSIIIHQKTGFAIPVFDWAVKKFSSYGADDGFAAKFRAVVNMLNQRGQD